MRSDEACTAAQIDRTEHDAADAVQQARAEAHQARLEGGDHGHLLGARPQLDGHARERLHLGVATGMVGRTGDLGCTLADDGSVEPDHCADREAAASFVGERELDGAVEQGAVEVVAHGAIGAARAGASSRGDPRIIAANPRTG